MGAPLPEMAGGKPYRDAKSEALGAPLWETADGRPYWDTKSGVLEFENKVININSGQNTSYMVP